MSDEKPGSFEDRLREATARQAPKKRAADATAAPSAMGIGLRVGVELVSTLIVGLVIGWGLDRLFGTRPILLAVFALLGGAAGVANVWRLMMPRGPKRGWGEGDGGDR